MKIVSIEQGRVTDLVPLDEIRPSFGLYVPEFIRAIAERYLFVGFPTDLAAADKSGAKFQHGRFIFKDTPAVIKELGIYSDGLIVDAFHTDVAESFLNDILEWAKEKFGVRERHTPMRRTFVSSIVFELDKDFEEAFDRLSKLTQLMSSSLELAYGWKYEYNLQRLSFAVDPLQIPHLRNTHFYIERKVQVSYSANRYWSGAPLTTERHTKLLEAIETELFS
jgi:hypothetical protein